MTQVRTFEVTFDTQVRPQYTRTETESAVPVPAVRFTEEFLKTLPGEWKIERWLGLGCTTATGTLVAGERTSPHEFHGRFHIKTSKEQEIEEEVTISTSGTKVHFEGGEVSVPDSVCARRARSRPLEEPDDREQHDGFRGVAKERVTVG